MNEQDVQTLRSDALTPAEMEVKAEQIGITKADMSFSKLFLLSIMAGMFIALGGMFMLLVKSDSGMSYVTSQLLGGLVFCLGLFLCISAGAELFTGNCLMIFGKLSDRYSWAKLLRNWGIVYLGNLVGSLIMVTVLFLAHYPATNGGAVGDAMLTVASTKINQSIDVLFFKGIMCNVLVCLTIWISFAARTITDKFFSIILPITAFAACGFEHCIANMFFLPMGFLLRLAGFEYTGTADISHVNLDGILHNISVVTVGNIVGGVLFVGVMYWLIYHKKSTHS